MERIPALENKWCGIFSIFLVPTWDKGRHLPYAHSCGRKGFMVRGSKMFPMFGAGVDSAEVSKSRGGDSDLRQQSRERNLVLLSANYG